jgi:hypothetical protein
LRREEIKKTFLKEVSGGSADVLTKTRKVHMRSRGCIGTVTTNQEEFITRDPSMFMRSL